MLEDPDPNTPPPPMVIEAISRATHPAPPVRPLELLTPRAPVAVAPTDCL
jgi:hypothetical protein